ncbi:MAG TPA: YidC/Oxa1 family membrane protein insertase [Candidatus Fimadaptatus faecigallinarum]|uniref:YidC/Oxa1 family membrane protein insertase n=1 Tax=Candidatus Fimadaptatus faecigallinarum TaxID=2840814 RepID=A0A9D1LQK4_9FIRM|nr:YidC/Oxa1 family membrane protein insertase [Candidatus Fimadaptatus faecigallinarum]
MQNLLISILRPLLELIYWIVPNYGWTVVIFTLVIRAILMPLDIKSRKSMKRMSNLKPQLDALNAKYANDKEKLQRKTAELYKKEKINPMSGCLPLIIQFPLLFGMLWTMQAISSEHIVQIIQTLEAGGTPVLENWLWVKNVFCADTLFAAVIPISRDVMSLQATAHMSQEVVDAAKAFVNNAALYNPIMVEYGATVIDSIGNLMRAGTIPSWEFLQVLNNPNGYYILPVLAAATQFLQTKLNPTETPQQGGNSLAVFMKYFFPLFSLWICLSSSAAFAIYWLTANVIAILQNVLIGKYLDRKEAKEKASQENA